MSKDNGKNHPKPQTLPGMENRAIEDLRAAALEYAEIRDQRQALTTREVELKSKVLGLMKAHKRSVYEYEGIEIRIVVEEETVKVRVHREELDAAVAAAGPRNVQLPPDGEQTATAHPAETPEEKEAFDGDPRASAAAEKSNHYPAKAPKRSERGKHLRPVTSSKAGKSAPA